ncbi:MAG: hypothetical protein AAGJ31_15410 [Verrucomicrobiota bacterium]
MNSQIVFFALLTIGGILVLSGILAVVREESRRLASGLVVGGFFLLVGALLYFLRMVGRGV